jgi:3-oxoacyl-[acyl-carrier protein] reductase
MPFIGIYAATKAAVEQMGFSLARELGSRGVTANAVLPGLTDTDGLRPEIRDNAVSIIEMTPLGRIGTPEDVAEVVTFLASEEARWVTGQTIGASGGLA